MTDLKVSELITKASTDHGALLELKTLFVSMKCYDAANDVRDLLEKNFPETDEMKEAKVKAAKLNLVFRMVELQIPEQVCHLISETLKKYQKKGGKFDINDAADLMEKNRDLFTFNCSGK